MLHQAAQQVVADQNGLLPHSAAGLLAVPGIGRYTAGTVPGWSPSAAFMAGSMNQSL